MTNHMAVLTTNHIRIIIKNCLQIQCGIAPVPVNCEPMILLLRAHSEYSWLAMAAQRLFGVILMAKPVFSLQQLQIQCECDIVLMDVVLATDDVGFILLKLIIFDLLLLDHTNLELYWIQIQ